jgi:hypothetical protein
MLSPPNCRCSSSTLKTPSTAAARLRSATSPWRTRMRCTVARGGNSSGGAGPRLSSCTIRCAPAPDARAAARTRPLPVPATPEPRSRAAGAADRPNAPTPRPDRAQPTRAAIGARCPPRYRAPLAPTSPLDTAARGPTTPPVPIPASSLQTPQSAERGRAMPHAPEQLRSRPPGSADAPRRPDAPTSQVPGRGVRPRRPHGSPRVNERSVSLVSTRQCRLAPSTVERGMLASCALEGGL